LSIVTDAPSAPTMSRVAAQIRSVCESSTGPFSTMLISLIGNETRSAITALRPGDVRIGFPLRTAGNLNQCGRSHRSSQAGLWINGVSGPDHAGLDGLAEVP
jgi:hypothetical protein